MAPRTPSLARRVAPAIALTGIGVILVNVLDRPTASGLLPGGSATAVTDANGGIVVGDVGTTPPSTVPTAPNSSASAGGTTPLPTAPGATTEPTGTVKPKGTMKPGVTTKPGATTKPGVTTKPAGTTKPPATAACGALKGVGTAENITERRTYGTIQVTAKFLANGTLCGVAASYNVNDQRSQQIEAYVVPILNSQAKAAKSANVNGVSGATAVTDAYSRSLQSAIDNKA